MSQNTLRQLMILGIGALFVLMLFIYKKSGVTGWQTMHKEESRETVKAEEGTENTENEAGNMSDDPITSEENAAESSEMPQKQDEGAVQVAVPGGNPKVRVLICSDNYEGEYHEKLTLQCSTDYTVSYGDVTEEHKASETVWFTPEDSWLAEGAVTLAPKEESGTFTFPDLKRSQKAPAYAGTFIVEKREEGLLVINEVPLETYLCSVVPSEMPADYPLEALKAQAICARTYAMKQLSGSRGADKGADMDDSVSYQVYNNIGRDKRTDRAVKETEGQVLMRDGNLIDALYYSTSCGLDLSQDLSDEAVFCSFISGANEKSYEKEEPWYRWNVYFSMENLTEMVKTGWQEDFGAVTGMEIGKRGNSGVIETLEISGDGGTIQAEGEYNIRKLLQPGSIPVTLQDGSAAPDLGMLPSAFFYLIPEYEGKQLRGYTLMGGGYGHGQGMSQNGARHMADAGYRCKDILKHYYSDLKSNTPR